MPDDSVIEADGWGDRRHDPCTPPAPADPGIDRVGGHGTRPKPHGCAAAPASAPASDVERRRVGRGPDPVLTRGGARIDYRIVGRDVSSGAGLSDERVRAQAISSLDRLPQTPRPAGRDAGVHRSAGRTELVSALRNRSASRYDNSRVDPGTTGTTFAGRGYRLREAPDDLAARATRWWWWCSRAAGGAHLRVTRASRVKSACQVRPSTSRP